MANLITLTKPQSAASEAYQSLRTNLEFARLDQPLHSVLLTSVDSTANKSIAIANLAVIMAQAGNRVILVDGDLRKPHQHEIFALHNKQGLSDWLEKAGEPLLQKTSVDQLLLLSAGPIPANPVSLLSAKRLSSLLALLREKADYVLCDAPPLLAVTDAALWASQVDGVALLINGGSTRREQAQRAKEVLERVHARVVGAVLLNAEPDANLGGYGLGGYGIRDGLRDYGA